MPPWTATTPWLWLPPETPTFTPTHTTARIVLFRKTFTPPSPLPNDPIEIHISADTRYILYINSKRILFGPAKSYLNEWNYETIDIKSFLVEGENVLSAKVLRYNPVKEGNMSMVRAAIGAFILDDWGVLGVSTSTPWKCRPDNSTRILPSSEWNKALGPAFLQINEDVNGNLSAGNWTDTDYDDSSWDIAVRSSMKTPMLPILEPWRLVPRSIPLLPEVPGRFGDVVKTEPVDTQMVQGWSDLIHHDKVVQIPANTTTNIIIENVILITAFLELKFKAGQGSTIRIKCAECFEYPPADGNPNPFARNKGNRTDNTGILMGPEDTYTVSSSKASKEEEQEEIYEPFWHRTFRYIQLTISTTSTPLTLTSLTYRRTHYPLSITTTPTFRLSSIEQKKWTISLNTLQNCTQETYTDCPFYEQNQFAFDSRLQILYSYQLSSDDRLARKTINEFAASRRGCDGLVETHFPTPVPGINIPVFSLSWVLMVYDYAVYAGDLTFIRRYLGGIDSVLNYFDSKLIQPSTESGSGGIGEGMIGRLGDPNQDDTWPFVDWTTEWSVMLNGDFKSLAVPPSYHRTGVAAFNSLLYAYTLLKAGEVCGFVGRTGLGDEYRDRARRVNEAVIRHCLRSDGSGEFLVDGPDSPPSEKSQHTAVFAVLSGAITGERAKSILHRALHPSSSSSEGYVKTSYAMSFYVLEAAMQINLYDTLREALVQPWKDMIDLDLTTWAESAAMPRSDCHGWSAVPVYDVVANVVGLRPVGPGYGRVRFSPRGLVREWGVNGVFNVGVRFGKKREVRVWVEGDKVFLKVGFEGVVEVVGGDGVEVKVMKKGETLSVQV